MVVAPLALSGTNYSTTSRHGSETLPSLWLSLVYNSLRRIRSPCALGPTWQPSNRSFEFLFRQRGRKVQGSALRFALKRLASVRRSLENRGNNRPPVIVVFRCNTDLITPLSLSSSPFPLSWVRMRYRVCRCPYRSVLRTVTIVGCGSRDRFEETDSEIFARIEWSSWQHVGLSCARRAFVGFFSSPRKETSGYSLPPSSQRRAIVSMEKSVAEIDPGSTWEEHGQSCVGKERRRRGQKNFAREKWRRIVRWLSRLCDTSRLLDKLRARAIIDRRSSSNVVIDGIHRMARRIQLKINR